MDLLLLDSKYEAISTIDSYISSIWSVRYNEAGDFELVLPVTKKNLDMFKSDLYIWNRDSDRYMVIDTILIESDAEEGAKLELTGESLEGILRRRVVADYTTLKGNLQDAIRSLLNANVISPSLSARAIPAFIFTPSTDPKVTSVSLKEETYFQGETVYDAIEGLCKEYKLGFKVLPLGEGGFEFKLYAGADRSYGQDDNPYIIFSSKMENLLGSSYCKSYTDYKNAALSIGTWQEEVTTMAPDGESTQTVTNEKTVSVWGYSDNNVPSGLSRRETFIDNGDLSGGDKTGNQSTWENLAKTKGREELAAHNITTVIDGQLEASFQYIYGRDFFIGDIVQVSNEFGIESRSYISEIVFSSDAEGEQIVPTFTSTEEEDI